MIAAKTCFIISITIAALAAGVCVYALFSSACAHGARARERVEAERTEHCTHLCESHDGMYIWWHREGWGRGAIICTCNNGKEIQIP